MRQKVNMVELSGKLGEPDTVVIDVRPTAAYNGWPLRGERRGGHLPGAKALVETWLPALDQRGLLSLLASKGIMPDKLVIIYGYQGQGGELAGRLADLGFDDLLIDAAGLEVWAADERLPLEQLPHYQKLVHPAWLQTRRERALSKEQATADFALFHVSYNGAEEYAAGHIPGAFYLDTKVLESPVDGNRRAAAELEAALLAHGITSDLTVVLYGCDSDPATGEEQPGQMAAMRAAVILMYAGVADVRLLDGGYAAWLAAGLAVETTRRVPRPAADFGAEIPVHPDYFIDLDQAKEWLADPGAELVSIRSWREYIGEVSGYDTIGPRGRIAGAVWGNCGSDAYHMQHYRNPDNTMRAYPEIAASWRRVGITPDKQVAFYCGTGWRASEAFFYAYLMGWPHIAVYDGGWLEWSSRPDLNPIEQGPPEPSQTGSNTT
jgi:thiosulfate/3-mercaptopyruvate sulfurtransferase